MDNYQIIDLDLEKQMQDFREKKNMTAKEIIEELCEIVKNQGDLSVKDLVDIVEGISVEDRIAGKEALTLFYTGESERLINKLVETSNENVRIIRRTDAYGFLADEKFEYILKYAVKYDNPTLSENELIKEVNRLLYEASYYDEAGNFVEGEGFWTIISRRFAADTTGDAYSLCCNGKSDRIFFMDELRTWLNAVSDDKCMCGYTKAELMAMNEGERFYAIKNTVIEEFEGTTAYIGMDDYGNPEIIGRTFGGTSLEGLLVNETPEICIMTIENSEYMEAINNMKIYIDSDGKYAGVSYKGTAFEGYFKDKILSDYVLEMDNLKYIEVKMNLKEEGIARAIRESEIYIGADGKIEGYSYNGTTLEGIIKNVIPSEYKYTTKYGLYEEITKSSDFLDIINSDKLSMDGILITKSMDGRIAIKRLVDFMGEGTNNGSIGKIMNNEAGITGIKKITNSEQGIKMDFGDFTVENRFYDEFVKNDIENSFEKYGNYTEFITKDGQVVNISKYVNWRTNTFKIVGIVGTCMYIYTSKETLCDAIEKAKNGDVRDANRDICGWAGASIGAINSMAFASSVITPICSGLAASGVGIIPAIGLELLVVGTAGIVGGFIGGIEGEIIGDFVSDVEEFLDDAFDEIGDYLYKKLNGIKKLVHYNADPLVLDLDGDGFELLSVKEGVYFDEDNRNLAEKTQWVSKDDALLALDLNGDGIINDGSELFGDSTLLTDGSRASSGFEALNQYDENNDGIINDKDAIFSSLKVWQDKNSDGVSQADEIYSMEDIGIESISLNLSEEDGRRVSEVSFADGNISRIGEFDFEAEKYNTKEKEQIALSKEISELPDVRAMGNVASLHTLMQSDKTGILRGYVEQFVGSEDISEKEKIVTDILYYITGAKNVATGSRGSNFDAKKTHSY